MATYLFVVKDKSGKTHQGTLEADSRNALLEKLWKEQLTVLSIDEVDDDSKSGMAKLKGASGKVKLSQLVIFSRQLATLIESGISVVPALTILSEQIEDKIFRDILSSVKDDVESGASLSEAAAKHPKAFSELYVNMLRAGEQSGQLDEILDRLAAYLEKAGALQRKVVSSLIYPAFVTLLAFGITAFLLIGIVPKFRDIFSGLGGSLPAPTLMLLNFSDQLRQFWVFGVFIIVAVIIGSKFYLATENGRYQFDKFTLKMPIFGSLLRKVAIARFSRTLATLIKSGVQILSALEIVARTSGNKIVEEAIQSARESIKEGENIADPLAESNVFPLMVTRMISVGEKTGELEKMLTKIADFYEDEVDTAVSGITSLIEPLVIAILGVMIGGIAVTLLLPVFNISSLVA